MAEYNKFRRKYTSLRLRGYDYRFPGYYFVTICTRNRQELFGQVENEKMVLNAAGGMVRQCWIESPKHYKCLLGEFVVMPNHVHGIVIIPGQEDNDVSVINVGAGHGQRLQRHSLSEIVSGFKSASARHMNIMDRAPGRIIWQRGFYDHIIRDEKGLENITAYIRNNPHRWFEDRNNPINIQ